MSDLALAEPMLASGGSVPAIEAGQYPHYKKTHSRKTLRAAWRVVYSNGISSDKEGTRRQVKEFSVGIESHLERIYRQLKKGKFQFPPSEGILILRKGKQPRPLVRSPIPSRIVQRAVLEVLQSEAALEPYYKNPTSFGGIRGNVSACPGLLGLFMGRSNLGVQSALSGPTSIRSSLSFLGRQCLIRFLQLSRTQNSNVFSRKQPMLSWII